MEIKRIQVGNGNCYLMINGKDAILVDTAREKCREKILEACRGYHVTLIALTHGHVDHVQNAAFLAEKLQAPIAMHRADLDLLENNEAQPLTARTLAGKIVLAASIRSFRTDPIPPFTPTVFLEDGDRLDQWGVPALVIGLPGHTKGSIGFDFGWDVIVGDALMNMFRPTVSMLYHDRAEMLRSAGIIGGLLNRTIYFGHGKPVRNHDQEWNRLPCSAPDRLAEEGKAIADRWLSAFGAGVDPKKIEEYVTAGCGYCWQLFSVTEVPYLEGEEARRAFDALDYDEAYFFGDWFPHVETIGKTTAAQLDAGPSDVYVVDKDFRWTYVHTHEDGLLGPYFCQL
ncbi:MAG: DUF4275 family protein [Oscillibacter sp.]|nr:DUF4275 family protein [Oscillibacter sp.]